jgi:hypothetical protein
MVDTDRSDNWGGPRDGSGRPRIGLLQRICDGSFNPSRDRHRELLGEDHALLGVLRDPADPQGALVYALIDAQVSYEIAADPADERIPTYDCSPTSAKLPWIRPPGIEIGRLGRFDNPSVSRGFKVS